MSFFFPWTSSTNIKVLNFCLTRYLLVEKLLCLWQQKFQLSGNIWLPVSFIHHFMIPLLKCLSTPQIYQNKKLKGQCSQKQCGTLDRKQMGSTTRDDWKFWVNSKKFPLKSHTGDSEVSSLGISWENLAQANLAENAFGTSDRTRMEFKKIDGGI